MIPGTGIASFEIHPTKETMIKALDNVRKEKVLPDLRGRIVTSIGGWREAERGSLWEAIREPERHESEDNIRDILNDETFKDVMNKPAEERDTCDHIAASVYYDRRGSSVRHGVDATDFAAGGSLPD